MARTKPKYSFTLAVSDSSANIKTMNSNAECGNVLFIREVDNNLSKWRVDDGKTWTTLHVPTGCYEITAINAEIIRIRGNITILPDVNTLQCTLTVIGAKCKVSFDVPNSLDSVLG